MKTKTKPPKKRGRPATGRDDTHALRCPRDLWKAAQRAAKAAGVSVSEWVRRQIQRGLE